MELATHARCPRSAPHWRLVYACGHHVLFTPPRTPDELLRLGSRLGQVWDAPCAQCAAASCVAASV